MTDEHLNGRSGLDVLPGIGPARLAAYASLGVHNLAHLLLRPPRRYVRFDRPVEIAALEPGAVAVIRGVIRRRQASGRRGRGRAATRLWIQDESGEILALVFGPSYLASRFAKGETLRLLGECKAQDDTVAFHVRRTVKEDETGESAEVFLAEYELPDAIPPRTHRKAIQEALERAGPALERARPRQPLDAVEAPPLGVVLRWLHRPTSEDEWRRARRLLAFEEALRLQRGLVRLRRARSRVTRQYPTLADMRSRYEAALPFAVNASQQRALDEIQEDLSQPQAMARLLTGDVGSGKTAVAFYPLAAAAMAGRQAALLAPTEILARQHHRLLTEVAAHLGLPSPVLLVRGAESDEVPSGGIAVGTHRLVGKRVRFEDLATVVVDEQHKFGVRQRFHLWSKGHRPDLLMVSATPIPRSLALTLFGHLDLSVLEPRPDATRQVATELLQGDERRGVADRIGHELERGGKAFVVCPAIGGSTRKSSARNMASAKEVAPWLRKHLPGVDVGVVHGRLEAEQKVELLERFATGSGSVLVATVVVEVGIDVPDASMVVVLGAERFGLSQLHQIRGRVGRDGKPASCLLVSAEPAERTRRRLQTFVDVEDGFELAEMDLELRGPGEMLGLRQHGLFRCLYPEVLTDARLLQQARDYAMAQQQERKSLGSKHFQHGGVATTPWIW